MMDGSNWNQSYKKAGVGLTYTEVTDQDDRGRRGHTNIGPVCVTEKHISMNSKGP